MKVGIFPFFIGSHTSAWHQPNDNGINASYKANFYKAVKRWRHRHPFSPFDRVAFNECAAQAIAACEIQLAADLASWRAKSEAWKAAGSVEELKPKGKSGNVVTRMYERTGWWPLKKDSELWNKAIDTFGAICNPGEYRVGTKLQPLAEMTSKEVCIRQAALDGFQKHFIDQAHAATEAIQQRQRRKANATSVPNTFMGKGFTVEEDLQMFKEHELKEKEKQAQKAAKAADKEAQVYVCMCK